MDVNFVLIVFLVLVISLGNLTTIGLAFLETGLVRARNTNDILIKNIALFALVSLIFLLFCGHVSVATDHYFLPFLTWHKTALTSDFYAKVLYQIILAMLCISIVIGATAERLRFWPFCLFTVLMLVFIYSIQIYWVCGGGFLALLTFRDLGGASFVYFAGAISAFTALLIIGPRRGKYDTDNTSLPLPGANIPLATVGMFLLWIGFIALNIAAEYFNDYALASTHVFTIYANTILAGSVGLLTVILFSNLFFGTVDLTLTFNGLIAGLVSISASPLLFSTEMVLLVALIASILSMVLLFIFDKCRIDDPVGVIASFGAGGTVSLLAVAFVDPWPGDTSLDVAFWSLNHPFWTQLLGVFAMLIYTFMISYLLWQIIRKFVGLRIKPGDEYKGLDIMSCGIAAYPEFTTSGREK